MERKKNKESTDFQAGLVYRFVLQVAVDGIPCHLCVFAPPFKQSSMASLLCVGMPGIPQFPNVSDDGTKRLCGLQSGVKPLYMVWLNVYFVEVMQCLVNLHIWKKKYNLQLKRSLLPAVGAF